MPDHNEMTDTTTGLGKESNSVPQNPNTKHGPDLGQDIARILKDIQLPERRGVGLAGATVKPKQEEKVVPPLSTPKTPEEPAPGEEGHLTTVHTFRDDLSRVAREQKISVIKAASLEEEKRHREKPKDFDATVAKQHSLRPLLMWSGVLVLLGVAALSAVGIIGTNPQPVPVPESVLMFSEQSVPLPLNQETGIDLKRILFAMRAQGSTLGSFTQVVPIVPGDVPARATSQEFFAKLDTHAPASLIRALGQRFYVGIHTVDVNAPLLVFTVDSYENAFAGMLEWESSLPQDLTPFFSDVPAFTTVNGAPERRKFTDEIIRNYDIRALHDDTGKIVFYYAFPSRSVLVIAESPFSFTEITTRLKAQRAL